MRVLYATDGSDPARAAGLLVSRTFRPSGASITVTAVARDDLELDGTPESNLAAEALSRWARKVVHHAAQEIEEQGFETNTRILEGTSPAFEILEELDNGGYDLVVIGAGRKTWRDRILLGSVSTRVLHESERSVLIVHEASRYRHPSVVLVGVDGSEHAENALTTVGSLLDPERCRVETMSVAEPSYASVGLAGSMPLIYPDEIIERERYERATHTAEQAARALEKEGFQVDPRATAGSPAVMLLKESDRLEADLVVVGSRGLGPVRRSILGSVSDQVARNARATLVVR